MYVRYVWYLVCGDLRKEREKKHSQKWICIYVCMYAFIYMSGKVCQVHIHIRIYLYTYSCT